MKLNRAARKTLPVVYLNTTTNIDERIAQTQAKFMRLMRSGDKAAGLAVSREASALELQKLRALGLR